MVDSVQPSVQPRALPELDVPAPPRPAWRGWALTVVAALAAAGATLAHSRTPTFDPISWAIWGRELAHGELVTAGDGAAFKPLPVFVDAVVSVLRANSFWVWLVVTRAAALLSLALAFRLTARLAEPVAGRAAATIGGVVAAGGIVLSAGFCWFSGAGMAEPLEMAGMLAAALAWVSGRRGAAVAWLTALSLLRPEAWLLLAAAGLVTAWGSPRRLAGRVLLGALVLAAWFAPEYAGSGNVWRSAERAGVPTNGGPQLTPVPGWTVLTSVVHVTVVPLVLLAIAVAVVAWYRAARGHRGAVALVAAAGAEWLLVLAAMAQLDLSTGVLRYLAPTAALACVLAGYGVAVLLRAGAGLTDHAAWWRPWAPRLPRVPAALAALAGLAVLAVSTGVTAVDAGRKLGHDVAGVRAAQARYQVLRSIVAAVGGWRAIDRCGRVATGPYENPIVAWELHEHLPDLTIRGVSRGTVVVMPSDPIRGRHGRDGLPPQLAVSRRVAMRPWVVASSCQLGAPAGGAP